MRFFPGILLVILSTVSMAADSGTRNRDGTEAFRNGKFQQAVEAFGEAERAAPDDLRIVFNRGAALTAAGYFDEAIEALQKSAVSRNPDLAAKSSALLGEIAVARIKRLLESEEETPLSGTAPERRTEILNGLRAAERHYMDSRLARSDRSETGTALEQIRSWRQRIESEWAEADRAEKRQSDPPERLRWLENWQREIASSVARQQKEPETPKQYQDYFETAQRQQTLSEEIGLLKDEFRQRFERSQENEEDRPFLEKGLEELAWLENETVAIGDHLKAFRGKEAAEGVDAVLQRINRLRIDLSPCEVIVQEAERKQTLLCDLNPGRPAIDSPSPEAELLRNDPIRQASEQQRIADWMPLVVSRAERWLEKESRGEFSTSNEQVDPEQINAYKETMQRAVQYGPEIRGLAEVSSLDLLEHMFGEASPKQQRALELLRKILEPLQNSQDQGEGEPQDRQNQDGKGEQTPSPQSQDQENEPPSSNQQRSDSSDSKQPPNGDQDEEREKAEGKLRQVKRRQQEAQEKRERIRAQLMQLEPVEKDW